VNAECQIIAAGSSERIECARQLFREYAAALDIDLCFQGFTAELAGLPGDYAPPKGGLWLVQCESAFAGCVALRPWSEGIGEMKRLYVRPDFRGRGLGRVLAKTAVRSAKQIGYDRLRLDTLDSMKEAITLYESLGFTRIDAYRHNPRAEAVYLELCLG